ncbi:hypothetical protein AGLY_002436 [Aphis glycines]|uniref:Uncharacterized protein n=1 Tax=Aphis glycines TaxID=307491 RepID=A0A6G0U5Y3_APHGL|nr:hypothetical protein AGLY_002436 [Aphis glycines]
MPFELTSYLLIIPTLAIHLIADKSIIKLRNPCMYTCICMRVQIYTYKKVVIRIVCAIYVLFDLLHDRKTKKKKSGIYDLYFLNNNKYLKSFEDKSLSLRYFLLEGKLMENLVLNFLSLDINTTIFMIFQIQNYLHIFAINSSKKCLSYNHKKNRFGRKLVLRKNSRFSLTFYLFFSIYWKMFTFNLYNAPRIFTLPSGTTLELCCTQTQKKIFRSFSFLYDSGINLDRQYAGSECYLKLKKRSRFRTNRSHQIAVIENVDTT